MQPGKIVNDIANLPPAAQRHVVEFIAFLKTRYTQPREGRQSKRTTLVNEPFVGIWKDREDMNAGSTWLRNIRKTEWGKTS